MILSKRTKECFRTVAFAFVVWCVATVGGGWLEGGDAAGGTSRGGTIVQGSPNDITPSVGGGTIFGRNPPPLGTGGWITQPGLSPNAALTIPFGALATPDGFAFVSGLASILGLLVTLYGTQIRTLSFSHYRSLVWRKVLLMSLAGGALVFSGIGFYSQAPPPGFPLFREIYAWLHGTALPNLDDLGDGTAVWALLFGLATGLIAVSITYDPVRKIRSIMLFERDAILQAKQDQLAKLFGTTPYDRLSEVNRDLYDETVEYYGVVQARMLDVLVGPSPPVGYRRRGFRGAEPASSSESPSS